MHTAIILSAGRGERLRPFTDTTPKALCSVAGKALIEYHISALARAGIQRVVINLAHLGGKIRQHLGQGQAFGLEIVYSPEPPGGLETGGGIYNALPLLGKEPFIAVNADIVCDYPFAELQLRPECLAHLVLVKHPDLDARPDFGIAENLYLDNSNRAFCYSGIAVYRPSFFADCQPGRYSLTPMLRAAAEKKLISAEYYPGSWIDIGTPEKLALANHYC